MKTLNLDLAHKLPGMADMSIEEMKDKKHYPSFTIETEKEIDFPHEGEAVIKFKKVASSSSERNGKSRYECTFDVLELVSVKGESDDSPSKRYDESGPALDKLVAAKSKKSDDSDY